MKLEPEIYISGHKKPIKGKEKIHRNLKNTLENLMKLGIGFGGFEGT